MESFARFYNRSTAVALLTILLTGAAVTRQPLAIVLLFLNAGMSMTRVYLQCLGAGSLGTSGNQLALPLSFMLGPLQAVLVALSFVLSGKQLVRPLVPGISLLILFVPVALTLAFTVAVGIKSSVTVTEAKA